ncbi:TraB/GumN family protein [Halpernia frigidisoli]|uniref:Erythromycin esterase n=1 Tax=Halpernia frigidisoli TaxID=1125876 RepID=A0A1I3CRG5_9FLAO|nr:hypothetical protein [Halpernia frigidisoli]SFH76859.1 hypothetical protein SAMN05443292_0018 [Halpernia frigidisoli]
MKTTFTIIAVLLRKAKRKNIITKLSLVFFIFLNFLNTFGQEKIYKNYLSKNSENIVLKSDANWKILKEDAEKNQLIVFGESHGAQNTQLIDFNLLKFLNKTVGTKNYIAELDYAQAENINDYLKTGNQKSIKTVFRYLVKIHAQWGNQDFYDKIVKIRNLNKTLSKDKKISFTGIDVVQDHEEYLKLIQKIINRESSTLLDSLKMKIDQPYDDANMASLSIYARNLDQKVEKNEVAFQNLLGRDYPLFKYLIKNLSYDDKSVGINRPEGIYRNFKNLYLIKHFENKKLYGMWGFFHAHLVPFQYIGGDLISKLVNSDHPIAKKIISIISLPLDSKYNVWNDETKSWDKKPFSYDNDSLLKVEGIEDLKELTLPNSTTLFKLNGTASPFIKSGRLLNGTSPQGKLVGDFINSDLGNQYIILIRNSDWLHPLPLNY